MSFILIMILPMFLIFLPMIILVMVGKRKNKTERRNFGLAFLGCFLLGLAVPILAT